MDDHTTPATQHETVSDSALQESFYHKEENGLTRENDPSHRNGGDSAAQTDYQEMRARLQELEADKHELEQKRYIDNLLNTFASSMRLRVDSTLESWAEALLLELVPAVKGLQAALYVLENEEQPDGAQLRRIGGYALPPNAKQAMPADEGLNGQVVQTREPLYFTAADNFYAHTESGLTKVEASTLLLQPLLQNEQVVGVLELTATQPIAEVHRSFLELLSETIAGNLTTLKSQVQIQELYRESQQRQEQLQAQEEEMRQNVEELEATQEEMRRVQREIKGSEKRMRNVLDNIPMGIVVYQGDRSVSYANTDAKKLLGEDILQPERKGAEVFQRINGKTGEPYPTAELPEHLAFAGETTLVNDMEILAGEKRIPVEVVAAPIYDENDELTFVVATYRNITFQRQKEAEIQAQNEELASREEELRQNLEELEATQDQMKKAQERALFQRSIMNAVLDNSEDAILTIAPDFTLLNVNATVRKNFEARGVEVEEGAPLWRFLPEEQQTYYRERFEKALAGERLKEDESFEQDGVTHYFHIEYYPIYNEQGNILGAVSLTRNVTAQEEKNQQIRENNKILAETQDKLQAAQRTAELRLKALNHAAIVSEANPKGEILFANDKFCELSGYSREELLGEDHRIVNSGKYSQEYWKQMWRTIGKGKVFKDVIRNRAKDGSYYYVDTTIMPVMKDNGKPEKYVAIRFDVTEQVLQREEIEKQAEEIQAQEEELRQNLEEMEATKEEVERISTELNNKDRALNRSTAIIEFDLEGNILHANENFLQVVKYVAPEVEGQHHRIFVEEAYARSAAYRQFWEKLGKGEFLVGEFRRLDKYGNEVWLSASYNPVMDQNGRPYKVIKFATDITENKRREEEMRQQAEEIQAQEEELRQNLEEMEATKEEVERISSELKNKDQALNRSTAVIEFDLEGNVLRANENFLQVVKYTAAEIEGKHHRIFVTPEYAASAAYRQMWEQLRRGEFLQGEFERIDKYGDPVWLSASYNPVLDENGRPYKIIKFATNITRQRLQQQKLEQTATNARETSEALALCGQRASHLESLLWQEAAMLELGADFTITKTSKPFLKSLYREQSELVGQDFITHCLPEGERETFRQQWRQLRAGEPVTIVANLQDANEQRQRRTLEMWPVLGAGEDLHSVLLRVSDATAA